MGELILCNQMLAAMPYYLDHASLNVYSLEELSYYIEHNCYLLDADFMSEELCSWIEQELGLKKAAETLRGICKKEGTLSEFVEYLLALSGYCKQESIRKIVETLREMEHKTEFECCKIRADRYMENRQYVKGIKEYRRMLQMEETTEYPLLTGNVWHNLGTAYARLFLFPDAAACLKQAYQLNQNPKSLEAALYAYRCMHDEDNFLKAAWENSIDEEERAVLCSRLTAASRMDKIQEFETELEDMVSSLAQAENLQETAVYGILDEWKSEYRKNCRI